MAAEFRWYCLRAMSGKELKVKAVLDAEIEKTDLGKNVREVIVPTEMGRKRKGSLLRLCLCKMQTCGRRSESVGTDVQRREFPDGSCIKETGAASRRAD